MVSVCCGRFYDTLLPKGAGNILNKKTLKAAAEEYFRKSEKTLIYNSDGSPVTDKNGGYVYDTPPPPNLSGLALALGFNSIKEMLSYKGPLRKQIASLITKCEDLIQLRLYDKDTLNGAKFTLTSCFEGWNPKAEDSEKELDALVSGLIEEIDNEAIG